jgi:hypothetical protein
MQKGIEKMPKNLKSLEKSTVPNYSVFCALSPLPLAVAVANLAQSPASQMCAYPCIGLAQPVAQAINQTEESQTIVQIYPIMSAPGASRVV